MIALLVGGSVVVAAAQPSSEARAESRRLRTIGLTAGYNLDYPEALEAFRAAIEADPEDPVPHRLFAATLWIVGGNLGGNVIGWYLGRRYGAEWLTKKMRRFHLSRSSEAAEAAEKRIEAAYAKYGWLALLVSKFVPGVRAMAPIAAGAMRVPLWQSVIVLFFASFVWYGGIAWIAFRVGADWESVKAGLGAFAKDVGVIGLAVGLVLVLIGVWIWRRRRDRASA